MKKDYVHKDLIYLENLKVIAVFLIYGSCQKLPETKKIQSIMNVSIDDCAKRDRNNVSLPDALKLPDDTSIIIINAIFLPILIISTVVINTLVCLVLLKPHMRTTTNTILTALAASDTLTGLMPLPCYVYFYSARYYQQYLPFSWCFLYFCLTDFLPSIFHTTSVWLTVSLAIQRYISVCHTQLARKLCNVRNACILSSILLMFASLSQLGRFFEMDYKPVKLISKFVVDPGIKTSTNVPSELQTPFTSNLSFHGNTSFMSNDTLQKMPVVRKVSTNYFVSDLPNEFSDHFSPSKLRAINHGKHVKGLYNETMNSYQNQNKKSTSFNNITKLEKKAFKSKYKSQDNKSFFFHENEFAKKRNVMPQIASNITKNNQKFKNLIKSNYNIKISNLLLKDNFFLVFHSNDSSNEKFLAKPIREKETDEIVLKTKTFIDTFPTKRKKTLKNNFKSSKHGKDSELKRIDEENSRWKKHVRASGRVFGKVEKFKIPKYKENISKNVKEVYKISKVIKQRKMKLINGFLEASKVINFVNETITRNKTLQDLQIKKRKKIKRSKNKETQLKITSNCDMKEEAIEYDGEEFYGCDYSMSKSLVSIKHYYYSLYYCFRILFVHLLPCLSLIVINALLLKTMWQGQSRRSRLLKMNRLSESRRLAEVNRTTLMLVAVVALFLVVELPSCVFFTLFVLKNSLGLKIMEDIKQAEIAVFVVNLCILLSYPMNFFIYCAMSTQFRNSFVELFKNIKNSAMEIQSVRPLPSNQHLINKNCEIELEKI